MDFHISKKDEGRTVKAFLTDALHPSHKLLRSLKFREDGITLNGERVTVRKILKEGDLLLLALDDEPLEQSIEPVDLPITILYEDDDLVVPAKPADMPTHPSRDHHYDTVANALAYRYKESGTPYIFRPINRLDRNTSGLLVVARNRLAAGRLTYSLQKGEFEKTYLAILDGVVPIDEGILIDHLHRTERVLLRGSAHTLVEARPVTGRTHQLRVQFSHFGYPIAGDDLYGQASEGIGRHALHAISLSFPHPMTGERMHFVAPIPNDFVRFANLCFDSCFTPETILRKEETE